MCCCQLCANDLSNEWKFPLSAHLHHDSQKDALKTIRRKEKIFFCEHRNKGEGKSLFHKFNIFNTHFWCFSFFFLLFILWWYFLKKVLTKLSLILPDDLFRFHLTFYRRQILLSDFDYIAKDPTFSSPFNVSPLHFSSCPKWQKKFLCWFSFLQI